MRDDRPVEELLEDVQEKLRSAMAYCAMGWTFAVAFMWLAGNGMAGRVESVLAALGLSEGSPRWHVGAGLIATLALFGASSIVFLVIIAVRRVALHVKQRVEAGNRRPPPPKQELSSVDWLVRIVQAEVAKRTWRLRRDAEQEIARLARQRNTAWLLLAAPTIAFGLLALAYGTPDVLTAMRQRTGQPPKVAVHPYAFLVMYGLSCVAVGTAFVVAYKCLHALGERQRNPDSNEPVPQFTLPTTHAAVHRGLPSPGRQTPIVNPEALRRKWWPGRE